VGFADQRGLGVSMHNKVSCDQLLVDLLIVFIFQGGPLQGFNARIRCTKALMQSSEHYQGLQVHAPEGFSRSDNQVTPFDERTPDHIVTPIECFCLLAEMQCSTMIGCTQFSGLLRESDKLFSVNLPLNARV
jgi:hypothetical protein